MRLWSHQVKFELQSGHIMKEERILMEKFFSLEKK